MGRTHRLVPKRYSYAFGPNEPAIAVRSGDRVVTTTRDCGGGDERRETIPPRMKPPNPLGSWFEANPLTGPIVVEGSEPGDTLAVHIRKITLTRDTAFSRHIALFGGLAGGEGGIGASLGDPQPEKYWNWKLDRRRMTGTLALPKSRARRATIPLHPFIGDIGVAPPHGQVEMSITPGQFGGNMDCPDVREGATVYFPVFAKGAFLYFGDGHAAQGDGEICGVALETSMEVTLDLTLIKGKRIEWPRLEDRTHIMSACSAKPLLDAFSLAQCDMLKWLETDHGFDRWEALQVLSQAGTSRVCNIVDPRYTVVTKFPKRLLPR